MIRSLPLFLALLLAACGPATTGGDDHERDAHAASAHEDHAVDHGDAHDDGEHHDDHDDGPRSIRIDVETAAASGVRVAPAGPGVIADEHEVQGLLTPIEGSVAQVAARFPGPVRSVRVGVGDAVRRGQLLATVESNLSLSSYAITAPISGVVMARNAAVGMNAGDGAVLFEIADLSELWVDLHLFGRDAQHITAGAPLAVTRLSDGVVAETVLQRVLPGTATASQSTVARATLANTDELWRPGSAVTARVTVAQISAELVVPLTALQNDGEQDVVYVADGEHYSQRAVSLGRRDGKRVEVLDGLTAGEQVVVAQSFLIKADIEKSAVEHSH